MKGLIIKDMMCLRKQRITFYYITICVTVLSVIFVLSAKFGNIAAATQALQFEHNAGEIDVESISTNVLLLFMLLPIAMAGDVTSILSADGKAGFERVSTVLPLSVEKRVLAKYLSIFVLTGMGVFVDVVLSFVLSVLTDLVSFREFLGMILAVASIMVLYGALTILYYFLFGIGKENYAQLAAIFSMGLGLLLLKYEDVKEVCMKDFLDSDKMTSFMHFIKYQSYWMLVISVGIAFLSCGLAMYIAKRRRGII